ncbi:hypothetical protein A9W98_17975 [Mycobacterium gordonae]|uniref:Uncharacterized protein n=1 Tax=Mycobacterium gordonae TaxID=1778 RepID=A0A1A6BHN9_MYCGO|nr:hypothetical protein A9W98_17975 [Mycobacterium gordonae]
MGAPSVGEVSTSRILSPFRCAVGDCECDDDAVPLTVFKEQPELASDLPKLRPCGFQLGNQISH